MNEFFEKSKKRRRRQLTAFEAAVYAAVRLVPRGMTATYGAIAEYVGCPSPRAVGQALRRNPFAPSVPCHRIIASDGSLGGYKGCRCGRVLKLKRRSLEREGVRFAADRVVPECVLRSATDLRCRRRSGVEATERVPPQKI